MNLSDSELDSLKQEAQLAASKGDVFVIKPDVLLSLFEEIEDRDEELSDMYQTQSLLEADIDLLKEDAVDMENDLRVFRDAVEGLSDG